MQADVDRILVVRIGALGDTLMATPLLPALGQRWPQAQIDFLCSAAAAPLLQFNPLVTRTFGLRQRNWPFYLSSEKIRLGRRLRQQNYDLGVLLESAPRYRFLLERGRTGRIQSFREVPFDPACHSILNNLRVAGFEPPSGQIPDMQLYPGEESKEVADQFLKVLPSPRIALHAGYGPPGRKRNQSRRLKGWSSTGFARLAALLLEAGAGVVLTGSYRDRTENQRIKNLMPDGAGRLIRDLAGRLSLLETAAVISGVDVMISVDSGPAHMAAALGTPLVVLWGPAKLAQVVPVSSRSPVCVVRHPVPCAPCYDTPAMKSCRLNICMQRITVPEVFETVWRLLGR